jgi:hypothetical protein
VRACAPISSTHEPLQAAKLAPRSLARRITELDQEIAALDAHLEPLVATAAPHHAAARRLHRPRRPTSPIFRG